MNNVKESARWGLADNIKERTRVGTNRQYKMSVRGWGLTDNVKECTRVGTNRQCSINTQGWGLTDNVTSTHKGAELTG